MPNNYCQTLKQKIEEIKEKAKILENLLTEYKETGNEEIIGEIDKILKEIEEFKKEFKNKATQLIEEFIQRRDNKGDRVEIIFDEKDLRFIIEGDLYFDTRRDLNDFPNLIKEIRGLRVMNVNSLDLPQLKKAGIISAANTQIINLINIEEIGKIYAPNAPILNLPKLKKAENIDANNAQIFDLSQLKKARGIYLNAVRILDLPNIEEAEEINADSAQVVNLPQLKKVKNISIPNTIVFYLPNLEEAEKIYVPEAQIIDLPKLKKALSIYAPDIHTLNLPNIQDLGNIYFSENIPDLELFINRAREWKAKGILKGSIYKRTKEGEFIIVS
jgi:hypothetical protein